MKFYVTKKASEVLRKELPHEYEKLLNDLIQFGIDYEILDGTEIVGRLHTIVNHEASPENRICFVITSDGSSHAYFESILRNVCPQDKLKFLYLFIIRTTLVAITSQFADGVSILAPDEVIDSIYRYIKKAGVTEKVEEVEEIEEVEEVEKAEKVEETKVEHKKTLKPLKLPKISFPLRRKRRVPTYLIIPLSIQIAGLTEKECEKLFSNLVSRYGDNFCMFIAEGKMMGHQSAPIKIYVKSIAERMYVDQTVLVIGKENWTELENRRKGDIIIFRDGLGVVERKEKLATEGYSASISSDPVREIINLIHEEITSIRIGGDDDKPA